MDDIAELQALLGAVQKQESKNRLNERNCRELLIKLIEKELVTVRAPTLLPAFVLVFFCTRTRCGCVVELAVCAVCSCGFDVHSSSQHSTAANTSRQTSLKRSSRTSSWSQAGGSSSLTCSRSSMSI